MQVSSLEIQRKEITNQSINLKLSVMSNIERWHGLHEDLMSNLLDKGCICQYDKVNNLFHVIYKHSFWDNRYDLSYISEEELSDILDEKKFNYSHFFIFVGISERKWESLSFAEKMTYLLSYEDSRYFFGDPSIDGLTKYEVIGIINRVNGIVITI